MMIEQAIITLDHGFISFAKLGADKGSVE